MRMTKSYIPTLREVPAEAELISHQYMLRAGFIRRSAAGIYTYLPLGLRVLQKIMNIIREELNKADGQEILLPIIQPAELWHQTGRWEDYGDEMFRLLDRNQRHFCLGPTHEEIVTALVKVDVRSYKELPIRLYQIQNKYRDEIRPRFGVIRGREFIMKDLYSFDQDEDGLENSYRLMYDAYKRIFSRCGLETAPVEADSGAIGGDSTHEFMVLGDAGEDEIVYCPNCNYAANIEQAKCVPEQKQDSVEKPIEKISTPNITTIQELTDYLNVAPESLIKTMIYLADDKPVAVLIAGNRTINEIKLEKLLQCSKLELADVNIIESVTQAPVGYAGPVGLKIPIIVDHSAASVVNGVSGANEKDTHLVNINIHRDYICTKIGDIKEAAPGDPCIQCGQPLKGARGTEVGQVFKLGTKYSDALGATFLDENGKEKPLVMGCYGIGVSRTMAAIIEQHHDEDGICWPVSVAPYQIVIVPVSYQDEQQQLVADDLYESLVKSGIETMLDDRKERAGVKFKDADLIGYPIRITIGPRHLKEGNVEITVRKTKEQVLIPLSEVVNRVVTLLSE